jgi:hypothetical protein
LLEPQQPTTQVIRRGEGRKCCRQANYEAILLAACPPGARRDVYLLLQPGADRISQPHPPGSVEHIIVTQGRALVGLTTQRKSSARGLHLLSRRSAAYL